MSTSLSPRSCFIYAATVIFIALAVCFSLLRAALPHAHGYVSELETTLSQQTGLIVDIESLDAEMSWFTPRLILVGIGVSEERGGDEILAFDRIELSLSYLDSIRFTSLRVASINLVLNELIVERLGQGRWKLQGFEVDTDGEAGLSEDLRSVLENTDFSVSGKKVSLIDRTGEIDAAELFDVEISVSHFLGVHTLAAKIPLPAEYGELLTMSARYSGRIESVLSSDTELYLAASRAELGRWSDRLQIGSGLDIDGRLDIETWVSLAGDRMHSITARLNGEALEVSDGVGASFAVERLSGSLLWADHGDDWSLQVRDLTYAHEGFEWAEPSDIDIDMREEQVSVTANYLAFHDAGAIAALLPEDVDERVLSTIGSISAATELYDLAANIDTLELSNSTLKFKANDLGVRHEGATVEGLDLRVDLRAGEGDIDIVTRDATLIADEIFRKPISFKRVASAIDVTASGSQWAITTDQFAVRNADLSARSRFAIRWSESEGLFLDIDSRIDHLAGSATWRYLPVNALNSKLIAWLDTAITDGRIEDGYFRLYGNSDDYPFENNGVMLAGFTTKDLNLRFNEEWPALGDLNADVRFDNRSMVITGIDASQYGARLRSLDARIDDLNDPLLVLDGEMRTPVKDVQRYIWSSPLDRNLGPAMSQLDTGGSADLNIGLRIPLGDDGELQLDGRIGFDGSVISYPALGYTLRDVRGALAFDDRSVRSEGMSAKLGGKTIRIDANSEDDARGRFTSIRFEGDMAADTLLTRFDWMPDHWFSGSSPWDIALIIPHYQSEYDVRVEAASDMRGTQVGFSDVVSKQPKDEYPLQISARIDGDVISIDAALPGQQMLAGTREPDGSWITTIETAHLAGKIGFHESMATDSTIELRLDRIDLGSLFDRESGEEREAGLLPTAIPSLRIEAQDVVWRTWSFQNVAINTVWNEHGMLITDLLLNGKDLEIKGQGTWLTSWRSPHETSLSLSTRSGNFGSALTALGYGGVIDGSSQSAELSLSWPAEPFGFTWQQLDGTADVDLAKGIVADIDTGTGGKLVGLFNVFHLPRRLLLDFDDLKDGFAFDRIKSRLVFSDGYASTEETDIKASIADMRVTGDVDMHNQLYDLVIRVKPNQSAAAFTGGAIAGGAVVGAGLVLLQKLLNIDKATQDRYSITGSWDEPVVTRLQKADLDLSSDTEGDTDDYQ